MGTSAQHSSILSHEAFQVSSWTVIPGQMCISRDGNTQRLTPKMMEVLVFFANKPGQVITKDELMEQDNVDLQEIAQFELDSLYLDFGLRLTKAVNNVSRLAGNDVTQAKLASDTLDVLIEFEEFVNSSSKIQAVETFSSLLKTPVSAKSTFTNAYQVLAFLCFYKS